MMYRGTDGGRMAVSKIRIGDTDVTGAGIDDATVRLNPVCHVNSNPVTIPAVMFTCGQLMSGRYVTYESNPTFLSGLLEVRELSLVMTCRGPN